MLAGAPSAEGALDLTELPHEVIDLSHSNPVDLSGSHHDQNHQPLQTPLRPLPWEPEPGFSFTDWLNQEEEELAEVDVTEGGGVFLGCCDDLEQSGLDLRLSEFL